METIIERLENKDQLNLKGRQADTYIHKHTCTINLIFAQSRKKFQKFLIGCGACCFRKWKKIFVLSEHYYLALSCRYIRRHVFACIFVSLSEYWRHCSISFLYSYKIKFSSYSYSWTTKKKKKFIMVMIINVIVIRHMHIFHILMWKLVR